ncbi:MAG TPA: BrnT family toxin [Pseudolabrys sp.]
MGIAADGFDWDAGNRDKCQKHGLTIAEIEHVVSHAETLIIHDEKNSAAEQRFIAVGSTSEGRYAFVAFTPRRRDGRQLLRPISTRFMHGKEVAKYEKESSTLQNR